MIHCLMWKYINIHSTPLHTHTPIHILLYCAFLNTFTMNFKKEYIQYIHIYLLILCAHSTCGQWGGSSRHCTSTIWGRRPNCMSTSIGPCLPIEFSPPHTHQQISGLATLATWKQSKLMCAYSINITLVYVHILHYWSQYDMIYIAIAQPQTSNHTHNHQAISRPKSPTYEANTDLVQNQTALTWSVPLLTFIPHYHDKVHVNAPTDVI